MRVLTYIAVFLFAVLQYRLWLGEGSVQDVWDLRKQVDTARIQTQSLVERNRALYAEVNDLKSGLEAVEEIARTDLGMIRKGEVFFQVVGEPEAIESVGESSEQASAVEQDTDTPAAADAGN